MFASRVGRLFSNNPSAGSRLASLDGLRGIAALSVLLGHLDLFGIGSRNLALVSYAKAGVYLFFALSAFLLTLIWLESSSPRDPRSWARYALRRVLRIYPLYTAALVTTAALLYVWPGLERPLIDSFSVSDVRRHLLLVDGLGTFWTIPVECKYYLLLPWVALAFHSLRNRATLALATAVAAAVLAHLCLWPQGSHETNTLALGPYLPIFLLGSAAAFAHWRIGRQWIASPPFAALLDLLAVACLAAVAALNGQLWEGPGNRIERIDAFAQEYLAYGVLWSVFLLAQLHGRGLVRAFFASPPLRFLGTVSFGLYLWHPVVIFGVRDSVAAPWPVQAILALGGMVLLSTATWLAIERPFLQLGLRAFRRPDEAATPRAPG